MKKDPISNPPVYSFTAKHLRQINDLSNSDIAAIVELAHYYAGQLKDQRAITRRLSGRTQVNLFFEDSTRTNMSFELAGKKLGADVINLPVAASSLNKNEEMIDTVRTLAAMGADAMIVRASEPGIHQFLSEQVSCAIINAGDGAHEHPTQALLDAITIIAETGDMTGQHIAICGDIRHSRVAGSDAQLFLRLGANVRFVGPKELMPDDEFLHEIPRVENLQEGLSGCNIVMALRMQFERMNDHSAINREDFYKKYAITYDTLTYAAPDAKLMHPGPINRGIEVESALADDPDRSLILKQVFYGVPTRMAVLDAIVNRHS